jgi:hypothetical protein
LENEANTLSLKNLKKLEDDKKNKVKDWNKENHDASDDGFGSNKSARSG